MIVHLLVLLLSATAAFQAQNTCDARPIAPYNSCIGELTGLVLCMKPQGDQVAATVSLDGATPTLMTFLRYGYDTPWGRHLEPPDDIASNGTVFYIGQSLVLSTPGPHAVTVTTPVTTATIPLVGATQIESLTQPGLITQCASSTARTSGG